MKKLASSIVEGELNLFTRYVKMFEALYFDIESPLTKTQIKFLHTVLSYTKLNEGEFPKYSSQKTEEYFKERGYTKANLYKLINRLKPKKMIVKKSGYLMLPPFILEFDSTSGFEFQGKLELSK